MHKGRKKKLLQVVLVAMVVALIIGLVLFALRQNINLFYTPSQVSAGVAPKLHTFRVGGLVQRGSVVHHKENLSVTFVLTDTAKTVTVDYQGTLPDLFREGQGIVAIGRLGQDGHFKASEVLAKHDESYRPPEVGFALKEASKS